jgi:transcriptional regulator NrdR family protein
MAKYLCECGEPTSVVETRPTERVLRRRRKCSNEHRFSTIEVPADAPKKIVELVQWAVRNKVTDDFTDHVRDIMMGTPEKDLDKPTNLCSD